MHPVRTHSVMSMCLPVWNILYIHAPVACNYLCAYWSLRPIEHAIYRGVHKPFYSCTTLTSQSISLYLSLSLSLLLHRGHSVRPYCETTSLRGRGGPILQIIIFYIYTYRYLCMCVYNSVIICMYTYILMNEATRLQKVSNE